MCSLFFLLAVLTTAMVPAWPESRAQVIPHEPARIREAVAALAKTLGHDDLRMRRNAARSLGESGPDARPGVPVLARLLSGSEASVREAATVTLGRVGSAARAARPALESALRNEITIEVRIALEGALRGIARALLARGALRGGVVVSTVMANRGLERALGEVGVRLVRTPVGDRHVLEEMRRIGANLGGEQSGHTIFLDHAPTGDGLVSALQLLRVLRETGRPLRVLAGAVTKCPQVLVSVRVRARPALAKLPSVGEVVARWEQKLDGRARILVRYSGTEPVARVMVEGDDQMTIEGAAQEIAAVIRTEIGGVA